MLTPAQQKTTKGRDPRGPAVRVVLTRDARAALLHAQASVVASGTATVEAALIGKPFVVVYRLSRASYAVAKRVVKVPHVAMANLIAGRRLVPELIQDEFTPEAVVDALRPLLADTPERAAMVEGLREVGQALQSVGASVETGGQSAQRLAEEPFVRKLVGTTGDGARAGSALDSPEGVQVHEGRVHAPGPRHTAPVAAERMAADASEKPGVFPIREPAEKRNGTLAAQNLVERSAVDPREEVADEEESFEALAGANAGVKQPMNDLEHEGPFWTEDSVRRESSAAIAAVAEHVISLLGASKPVAPQVSSLE